MFPEAQGIQHGIIYYRETKYFFYLIIFKDEIIDFIVHQLVEQEDTNLRFEHVPELLKLNLLNILMKKLKE
jgi:hypothetical protein